MWYLILTIIAAIYIILNLVVPATFSGFMGSYIIRPLLWAILAILVYLTAKQEGVNIWQFKKIRKWEIGKTPFQAALLIGGFQVSLLIIFGLFSGFGKSPYGHSPLSLLLNTFYIGTMLLGIELSRAYLIKKGTTSRKNITLTLTLVTILFMLIIIPLTKFNILYTGEPANIVKFLGETIIPLLAMSLFASYLAYIGGALSAIGYMGILQAFEWFSPVLPDLNWTLTALVGTIGPAIGFLIIQNSIQLNQPGTRRTIRKKKMIDPALSWTGVAVISLLLVFFSFGYLGVQPTVIYSGSMRPVLDVGDIVIISEVPIDEIQEGDIIQFRLSNTATPIVHRVYDLSREEDTKVFITKGDANGNPDSNPVIPDQITGKAVFNIPKIGWIPITMRQLIRQILPISV